MANNEFSNTPGVLDKDVLMENADLWLKVEDKLKREWSTLTVSAGLTAELLKFASENLAAIEPGVKIRLVLSLLRLSTAELQENKDDVIAFLNAATKDNDPWPQVMVDLVSSRLVSSHSEGESPPIAHDDVKSSGVMQSATDYTISRLLNTISERNQGPESNDPASFPIPLDFFPMEWPYLCSNLLKGNLNLEECGKNIHFTPLAMTKVPAGLPESLPVQEQNRTGTQPTAGQIGTNPTPVPRSSVESKKQELQQKTAAALAKYRAMAAGNRGLSSGRSTSGGVKLVDFETMEKEMEQNRRNNAFTKKRLMSATMNDNGVQKQARDSQLQHPQPRAQNMQSSPGPDSSPGSYDPAPSPNSYPNPSPSPSLGSPINSPGYGSPQSPGSPGGGGSSSLLTNANKMSPEDRDLITRFLNREENPDPAKGDERTVLHSTRKKYVPGSNKQVILVESIYVRINFATKAYSKMRKKKQFKVRKSTGGLQSPPPQSPP